MQNLNIYFLQLFCESVVAKGPTYTSKSIQNNFTMEIQSGM